MITLTGTTQAAGAWFARLETHLDLTTNLLVEEALDDVIRMLVPVTPVKSGAMKADYTIAGGGDVWELLDTAESPAGYNYPGRVVFDPNFSHAYGALTSALDSGIRAFEATIDAAITRMATAP